MNAMTTYQLIVAKQTLGMKRMITSGALVTIVVTLLTLLSSVNDGSPDAYYGVFSFMFLVVAFAHMNSDTFNEYKNPKRDIQWYLLPASQFEKWLANLITSFLLLPIAFLVLLSIATLMAKIIAMLFGFADLVTFFNPLSREGLGLLQVYWFVHPTLFFAAAYFNKRSALKFWGIGAALFIGWAFYIAFVGDLLFGGLVEGHLDEFDNLNVDVLEIGPFVITEQGVDYTGDPERALERLKFFGHVAFYAHLIYFWALSYTAFKERES